MSAPPGDAPPQAAPPDAAPPGSRAESVLMWLHLMADLLSNPFHFAMFLLTRSRQRRALERALKEAAS